MKTPKSELVSRAGVHYAGYVFSTEGVIFRETSSTDVGVDGQLELVSSDGFASGVLIGIQIKSGDSFVDSESKVFSFKASKEHFSYWQKLSIPVIGVVYSPTLKIASWFDLTKHAKEILANNSPPIIRQNLNKKNTLEIGNGLNDLIELIDAHYKLPVTTEILNTLCPIQESGESIPSSKEESWKRLITIFFASHSDSEIIGEVGYRLSWYFPVVSEEKKLLFKKRLLRLTIPELDRIFKAIKLAEERDRDDVATHILDLLSYHPNVIKMFKTLELEGFVAPEDSWLLEQIADAFKK